MKLQPTRDLVEIKVDPAKDDQDSTWITLPPTGTITGVGPEVKDFKVGDRVLFARFAAIKGLEDDSRLCQEKHIFGRINGKG